MTQSNARNFLSRSDPKLEHVRTKRRWTEADARFVLAAQLPDETQAALAERLGLDPARLSRWRSSLRRVDSETPAMRGRRGRPRQASALVEVALAEAGAMVLGRRGPVAILELVDGRVRIEVMRAESLGACVDALLGRTRS